MNVIAAVDQAWGIGSEGKLLASIPEDMKFFRQLTIGKTILMGRKTLESFPGKKPLSERRNIVLSKTIAKGEGCEICASLDQAFSLISELDSDEIFVVGGQEIYEMMLPYCRLAYITKINRVFPADCYFPNLDKMQNWVAEPLSDVKEHDGLEYQFWCYRNLKVQK